MSENITPAENNEPAQTNLYQKRFVFAISV